MKKIIVKSILMMALLVGLMLNINTVRAEEKPTYTTMYPGGGSVEFYGSVTPNRKFYYGYGIVPENDFNITGYAKVTFPNGNADITTNIKISTHDDTDLYNSNQFKCSLIVHPEKDYSGVLFSITDPTTHGYYDYSMPIIVDVNREKFDSSLTPNYENGYLFDFNNIHVTENNNKIHVMDSIGLKFFNSLGEEIQGTLFYKNTPSSIGATKVYYTFTPYNTSTKLEYEATDGYVIIDIVPKIAVSKKESTKIILKQNNKLEYKLSWKKTWQDSSTFTNLKPNTVYTIHARVKEKYSNASSRLVAIKVRTAKE